MKVKESILGTRKWKIQRYNNIDEFINGQLPEKVIDGNGDVLDAESIVEGNVLLNEGINDVLIPLLSGVGASPTIYNEANAYIGVGSSSVDPTDATKTGLTTVLDYKGMDTGYPQVSAQKVTWRSIFGADDANGDWREFTVSNAADNTGNNFNRKVDDQGTKVSGQIWTIELEIEFS